MSHFSEPKLVDIGLIRAWLWSALLWLLAFAVLGLLLAVKFNYPDFLGGLSWLTFGRLRPAHVDGMVFGVYSTAALGLLYYYVPMLCARPMVAAAVGWWAFYAWNAAVGAATLALLWGYNAGIEFAEYAWPPGLAALYYFLPLAAGNALFSRRLALLGFWLQAAAFPLVGVAEYLYSPIPHMQQTLAIATGILLALSMVAVAATAYGTAAGRWLEFSGGQNGASFGAKFIMMGTTFLLIGAVLGVVGSLRSVQGMTHFTDYPIAHDYAMLYAGFMSVLIGGMYYAWPRITGRELWNPYLASWHLWLTLTGGALIIAVLGGQGCIQGYMLRYGAGCMDALAEMDPWWLTRSLGGVVIGIGFVLLLINLYRSERRGAEFAETTRAEQDMESPSRPPHSQFERMPTLILIPGAGFLGMALAVQAGVPLLIGAGTGAAVRDSSTGKTIETADYTPLEQRGRDVYVREGCGYCHSQQIRPVALEEWRWGPVAQGGEYFYDRHPVLGTRRIGPDLLRVGRNYGDDWHAAQYWDPRALYPRSNMPAYPWLFERSQDPNAAPRLNGDGQALNAYLQRLGTRVGEWRETFARTSLRMGAALQARPGPNDAHMRREGRDVYQRWCQGCHGVQGRGDGPAARFLALPPTDFTAGIFKFRSTLGADSLPSDQDLYATVNNGLAGTAMGPWYELDSQQRMAVVQYIKSFSARWNAADSSTSLDLPPEPAITAAGLARGKTLYARRCANCHGEDGRGAPPGAAPLKDRWERPLRVPDLTLPLGRARGVKRGHHSHDYFTVIMTGVGGTPMLPLAGTLDVDEIWDIAHYAQSLRVDAHMRELRQAGLQPSDDAAARGALWSNLSRAATAAIPAGAAAAAPGSALVADRH